MNATTKKLKYKNHTSFTQTNDILDYDLYSDQNAFKSLTLKSSKDDHTSQYNAYLVSLGKYGVLTKNAEYRIFLKYNYLKYLAKSAESDSEAKLRLIASKEIKEIIIKHNLRLIIRIVKEICSFEKSNLSGYKLQLHSFEDWVGQCNVWLCEAIESFDVSKGFKFSTYLTRVCFANSHRIQVKSTRSHINVVETDTLQSEADTNLLKDIETAEIYNTLYEHMSTLDQKELDILCRKFGLYNPKTGIYAQLETLQEIGNTYGITAEWARRISVKAIQKLQYSGLKWKVGDLQHERVNDSSKIAIKQCELVSSKRDSKV